MQFWVFQDFSLNLVYELLWCAMKATWVQFMGSVPRDWNIRSEWYSTYTSRTCVHFLTRLGMSAYSGNTHIKASPTPRHAVGSFDTATTRISLHTSSFLCHHISISFPFNLNAPDSSFSSYSLFLVILTGPFLSAPFELENCPRFDCIRNPATRRQKQHVCISEEMAQRTFPSQPTGQIPVKDRLYLKNTQLLSIE